MELKLNESNVRAMAERLRAAVGPDVMRQGKSLEVLAKLFGHKNWDTFIGLLRRPDVAKTSEPTLNWTTPAFEPVTLYLEAFSTTMYGDGPSWAKMTLTTEWLEEVREKVLLCLEHNLDHVAVSHFVDWYDPNEEYRMGVADLYITSSEFWYRASPKHADYATETRSLTFDALVSALANKVSEFDSRYIQRVRDVIVYDSSGNPGSFLETLVDEGELAEDYLEQ